MYGYGQQTNQSFESDLLPSGSYVTTQDSVKGVFVPAGGKVNLGNFSAACLTDSGTCENFTVSFLFKINGSISENETVDIIDQTPVTDAGHRLQFSVSQNTSHYMGVATVARGDNRTEVSGLIPLIHSWIHAAVIFAGPDYFKLFLNGTDDGSNASSVPYTGSVTKVDMTLGSSNSSNGFFVSYLQVIGDEIIKQADVNSLKYESFAQGKLSDRVNKAITGQLVLLGKFRSHNRGRF